MSDDPTTRLVVRLVGWLYQQPEWVQVFAADRSHRRALARAIAKTVTTIPAPKAPAEKPTRPSKLTVVKAGIVVPGEGETRG